MAEKITETEWTVIDGMDYSKVLEKIINGSEMDFRLVGTAFENRFWGDQNVIKFDGEKRTVNLPLLLSYANDWAHRNKKAF